MKIALTGASGFIGSALRPFLTERGHETVAIPHEHYEAKSFQGLNAVIHLAGANIASQRWTGKYKKEILESRAQGTLQLANVLAALEMKPKVFISASAVGYYGFVPSLHAGLSEQSPAGEDFLARVCLNWEAAAEPARKAGIRVVHPRIGMVLGRGGGALGKMLLPFRLGLGGILGDGQQVCSWISLHDLCRAILHLLENETSSGPYNLSAPEACTNAEFTHALGKALKRPTPFPMPAFAARLVFGEMAEALLLNGQRAIPQHLEAEGFRFEDVRIAEGLARALRPA